MKWIPIEKAKVKFKQLYLLADKDGIIPELGTLAKTETTTSGLTHTFNLDSVDASQISGITHVAAVSLPGK